MAFWLHFRVLGGVVGGSWGLSWGILARSWAILGDLGVKMGPSWQDVGTTMAKMSQDWPKMANLSRKSERGRQGMVTAAGIRARVGGCPELEFRDFEELDGLETRFNTPWRLPSAGAGGYPALSPKRDGAKALRAQSRHRAITRCRELKLKKRLII